MIHVIYGMQELLFEIEVFIKCVIQGVQKAIAITEGGLLIYLYCQLNENKFNAG